MAKATTQMSFLAKLELTQLKAKPQGVSNVSPTEKRREKLLGKLQQQAELANAMIAGEKFIATKQVTMKDADGNKSKVQKEMRVAPWFWSDGKGMQLVIRYGVKPLPLSAKSGHKAISVPNLKAIPGVIATVIEAVNAGELDDALSFAAVRETKKK